MRHVTRFSTHYINSAVGWVRKNLPYDGNGYTFTHPARTKYLEVLNYIAANPGCKRIEIIKAVWPRRNNFPDSSNRGFSSNLFSNMLYADLIDYNSKYEYIVRPWGCEILEMYRESLATPKKIKKVLMAPVKRIVQMTFDF